MPRTLKGTGLASAGGKRFPLNLRTTKEIRELLEEAARTSGRSLAQEIETRVEQTFRRDAAYGGVEGWRLSYTMAASFLNAAERAGEDWTRDSIAYVRGAAAVLDDLLIKVPHDDNRDRAIEELFNQVLSRAAREKQPRPEVATLRQAVEQAIAEINRVTEEARALSDEAARVAVAASRKAVLAARRKAAS
jgi:hypothetical protein